MIKLTYKDGTDYVLNFGTYPDGTSYFKYEEAKLRFGEVVIVTMNKPTANEMYNLYSFLYAKEAHGKYLNASSSELKFFFPMFPGGRQDKKIVKDGVDFLVTLSHSISTIMKVISGSSKVYTVDPHSVATTANNMRIINPINVIEALGDKIERLRDDDYDVVIAPDSGAKDRAELIANALDVPLLLLQKHRDISTGMILRYSGFDIGRTKGLVVDDICDGGATFNMLALSGNPPADLNLFVTFGIFSKGLEELSKHYNKIYTTDLSGYSIPDGVITIEVLDRLIKEIAAK